MSKIYLDITKLEGAGTSFVGIEATEIILTGTIISSMSTIEKNDEYQRYPDDYDI